MRQLKLKQLIKLKQFWEVSNKWLTVEINWEFIFLFCFKIQVLILCNIDYTILESMLSILNTDIKFSICLKWMYVIKHWSFGGLTSSFSVTVSYVYSARHDYSMIKSPKHLALFLTDLKQEQNMSRAFHSCNMWCVSETECHHAAH